MGWMVVSDTVLEYQQANVEYYRSVGDKSNPTSIDPEGGPFIKIGATLCINDTVFKIKSFSNVTHENGVLKVQCEVNSIRP